MRKVHKEIGAIVREYRNSSGLTQLGLAEKLGYDTPQFVSLFERGLSKIPLETIGQLVVLLGIPERKIMNALIQSYEKELAEQINHGKKKLRA